MLRPWKIYPARRRALALVRPFVERTRIARSIPDSAWLDPYFVGFIGMLVTLAASGGLRALGNDELAAVQSGAWAAITGMRREMIGDEICSLSADHDVRFEQGCVNAASFFMATQTIRPGPPLGSPGGPEERPTDALWDRFFVEPLDEYLRGMT
jgi:hypothetical protein